MSNFSPKIEDSSAAELYHSVNEHDPRFSIISSNELTKRSLDELKKTIELFNKESSAQTHKMLFLTYTTTFLTAVMLLGLFVQIFLALFPSK